MSVLASTVKADRPSHRKCGRIYFRCDYSLDLSMTPSTLCPTFSITSSTFSFAWPTFSLASPAWRSALPSDLRSLFPVKSPTASLA